MNKKKNKLKYLNDTPHNPIFALACHLVNYYDTTIIVLPVVSDNTHNNDNNINNINEKEKAIIISTEQYIAFV